MSTCPILCHESSPTPSHMPKPNASKISSFKNKSFLFSKTYYRVSVKFIGQPSEANLLDNPPKQFTSPSDVNCWTISQHNSPENLPSKFLSQTFFLFIFFHIMHSLLIFPFSFLGSLCLFCVMSCAVFIFIGLYAILG